MDEYEKQRQDLRNRIMNKEVDMDNIEEEAIKLMKIDPVRYVM